MPVTKMRNGPLAPFLRAIEQEVEVPHVSMIYDRSFRAHELGESEKRARPTTEARKLLIADQPRAQFKGHGKSLIAVGFVAAFELS
jgi:hypothetical protein